MKRRQELQFRLMTYNTGGGRKYFSLVPSDITRVISDIIAVIKEASPDILVVQEAVEYQDADGVRYNTARAIAQAVGFGENFCFGPTLSMREHMHVKKAVFVQAIFNDWEEFVQGNAVFSRWGFVRLSDVSKHGEARNIPLYRTPLYDGNRDTDPRYALVARVNMAPIFPFVVGTHFTTLVGERTRRDFEDLSKSEEARLMAKVEEAQLIRYKQAKRLLDLLRDHVLGPGEMIFLLGDFNAMVDEPCISSVLKAEGGFVHLIPTGGQNATHPKAAEPIDHIFIYPRSRLIEYRCWTVDSPTAQQVSDHLPVVADVTVSHLV